MFCFVYHDLTVKPIHENKRTLSINIDHSKSHTFSIVCMSTYLTTKIIQNIHTNTTNLLPSRSSNHPTPFLLPISPQKIISFLLSSSSPNIIKINASICPHKKIYKNTSDHSHPSHSKKTLIIIINPTA